ncbi:MAG: histidine triad nucleotide-binding protein [Bacillota bacterium]|nr:histidine triad nucleotide-binding protein [Bacillota bacterium]
MVDCLFCKIAEREIPSQAVYEDDEILAFHDINPVAPVHILVIPKKHIDSLEALAREDEQLAGRMLGVIRDIATEQGLDDRGWRVVVNTGQRAGQSVKHLHFHILGGRDFGWPPG